MENFARVVFTIIFITILAGVIVAFSLFAIAPTEKVLKVLTGGVDQETGRTGTRTDPLAGLRDLFSPSEKEEEVPPSEDPAVEVSEVPPPPVPTPGTPENPYQSAPVSGGEVPTDFIKMTVSAEGFAPSRFAVPAGGSVGISLTSGDHTHIFKFENPSLKNVAVGVGPGETRLIEFYAPTEKGEYVFYCDVPGHRARGEEGVMVVE